MKSQISKKQVACLASLFYVSRKVAGTLIKDNENINSKAIDSIVANKVVDKTSEINEEGAVK